MGMVRTEGGGVSVWKWTATTLATLMVGGALILVPAYIALLRTPSKQELELVRERQEVVLQRLAAIDERLNTGAADRAAIHEQISELETLIHSLIAAETKAGAP